MEVRTVYLVRNYESTGIVQDQILLMEIKSGTDDAIRGAAVATQASEAVFGEDASRSYGRLVVSEFETDGTKNLYWLLSTTENADMRGWFRLESQS